MKEMQNMKTVTAKIEEQRYFINNVSRKYLFVKRLFDIVLSLLAIILVSPVLLVSSLWILFKSRSAVLFTEEKYGEKGRRFRAYMFSQSMSSTFIRKLPLLFNVLKGDMSFVGPDPVSTKEVMDAQWHNLRLSAKPGITGLWQINGKTGAFSKMIRVDLKYIRERSFSNDFKIILKAVCLMVGINRAINNENGLKDLSI